MENLEEKNMERERNIGRYKEAGRELLRQIASFKAPLAHGTTSEHLESILRKGYGKAFPENAYAKMRSLTDLRKPDGLLGAYAFARMNTEDLAITSEEINGEDLITRYVKLNSLIEEARLREAFREYAAVRKPTGFPVLFVFDGGATAFEYINPRVPSEVKLGEFPEDFTPKIILVPEKRIAEIEEILKELGLETDTDVLAIETLEVIG